MSLGNHFFVSTPLGRPCGDGSRQATLLARRCAFVLFVSTLIVVSSFSPSPPSLPSTIGRRGGARADAGTRAKTRNGGLFLGSSRVRQRGGSNDTASPRGSRHPLTSLRGGGDEVGTGSSSGGADVGPATDVEERMPTEAAALGAAGTAETLAKAATTVERVGIGSRNRAAGPPPGFLRKTFPNLPWHRLPDYLTYARCAAIPLLAFTFYHPKGAAAQTYRNVGTSLLFAAASFTDWLDGYLARRWECSTAFGAFLDPVADKLMVSTALVLLSGRYGAVIALPSAVILAREIAVSALREWMAKRNVSDAVKVGWQGKCKTALTMVAVTVLLFVPYPPEILGGGKGGGVGAMCYRPGLALLYASALLTVTSGSVYFRAAAPVLLEKDD